MRDTNDRIIPTCSAGGNRNRFSCCLSGEGIKPTSSVLLNFIDTKEKLYAITAVIS